LTLTTEERTEIEGVFKTLAGMIEGLTLRVEQIERLLTLRLKTKLMVVSGKDDGRGAAELLEGIREGVQIETILLDIGARLHDLEYHCFASETDKAAVAQLMEEWTGPPESLGVVDSDDTEAGGEDAVGASDPEVPGSEE
jgi:hypothetical protein